jgi:hypothetical protein
MSNYIWTREPIAEFSHVKLSNLSTDTFLAMLVLSGSVPRVGRSTASMRCLPPVAKKPRITSGAFAG